MQDNREIIVTIPFTDDLVNGTGTLTSDYIILRQSSQYSIWIKADSAGTPNVNVDILCGYNSVTADMATPTGWSAININDKNVHIQSLSIPVCRYIKVKLTGQSGNPADTTVTAVIQHL